MPPQTSSNPQISHQNHVGRISASKMTVPTHTAAQPQALPRLRLRIRTASHPLYGQKAVFVLFYVHSSSQRLSFDASPYRRR